MLLKSLIRRTVNVNRHKIVIVKERFNGIEVHMDRNRRHRLACGQCGTLAKVRDRLKPRRWKHVPLWGIPVTLVIFALMRIADKGRIFE